jgi:hypothetical protein
MESIIWVTIGSRKVPLAKTVLLRYTDVNLKTRPSKRKIHRDESQSAAKDADLWWVRKNNTENIMKERLIAKVWIHLCSRLSNGMMFISFLLFNFLFFTRKNTKIE